MTMRFALAALAALAAAPAAVPAAAQDATPAPRTVEVELQTTMGHILISLEVERAPITAGNFLRYVDEHRLDGTVFYRSMVLDWEPHPNGLVQAGTQFDPARILPPIAHEPTSVTGLTHARGALSMGRNEPGSANGDFSILLQAQPSMDAGPNNPDPRDPDKGEGWMKGEMLAEQVVIVRAIRAADE